LLVNFWRGNAAVSVDGLLSHRSSQIPSSLRKSFSGYSDCIDPEENSPRRRGGRGVKSFDQNTLPTLRSLCLCGEISLAALVAALGGVSLGGYFFTANPENYFLIPSSRCASRSRLVSATSFEDTWRAMFIDF
jgi:hypothetical protein